MCWSGEIEQNTVVAKSLRPYENLIFEFSILVVNDDFSFCLRKYKTQSKQLPNLVFFIYII